MKNLSLEKKLFSEIKNLIDDSKRQLSIKVNQTMTLLYWNIGKSINENILQNKRADYGKEIVSELGIQLTSEYGKGYTKRNLQNMVRFYKIFGDEKIVHSLSAQLSWTHIKTIIYLENDLKRDFYIYMSMEDNWSTRVLKDRIDSQLYERTALSKKPEELISNELKNLEKGTLSKDIVLKDPYILDFLELKDRYLEKDFEDAILRELEQFILELGVGFTFVERQKRIQIDNEDFYIDLLFYNRKLKSLVVLELKIGTFKASYKGQMELYLKWLEKHEKEEGENSPIGIILCANKQSEQVELLELDNSNIHVAQYLTVLPEKEKLQAKLHDALLRAKEKYNKKAKD